MLQVDRAGRESVTSPLHQRGLILTSVLKICEVDARLGFAAPRRVLCHMALRDDVEHQHHHRPRPLSEVLAVQIAIVK